MNPESTSKPQANPTARRDEVGVRCLVHHLDLFSGIGGFALAAQMVGGIETVGFCEIDPWAQKVLNKNFPGIPCHDDVKTLIGNEYGRIDLITGGYPCQPFSVAGQQRGAEDDRHLWPEVRRIIENVRPRWVLCENVAGHVKLGLDEVLSELESLGYTARATTIPACAVDAHHRRDRVWIVGYSEHDGSSAGSGRGGSGKEFISGRQSESQTKDEKKIGESQGASRASEDVADTMRERLPKPQSESIQERPKGGACERTRTAGKSRWEAEPSVGRVVDGLSGRVDRLRGLGNAIVPQVAAEILRVMMTVDDMMNVKTKPPTAG